MGRGTEQVSAPSWEAARAPAMVRRSAQMLAQGLATLLEPALAFPWVLELAQRLGAATPSETADDGQGRDTTREPASGHRKLGRKKREKEGGHRELEGAF